MRQLFLLISILWGALALTAQDVRPPATVRVCSATITTNCLVKAGPTGNVAVGVNVLNPVTGFTGPNTVGTAAPEAGVARLFAPPGVMTSPPTVTVGIGGATSSIAGSTLIPASDVRYRYFGALASGRTGDFTTGHYSPNNAYHSAPPNYTYSKGAWGVEFESDAAKLEFLATTNALTMFFRISIDGAFATQDLTAMSPPSGSGNSYVLIDNGTRRMRRYRLEFSSYFSFYGINLGKGDTIWYPTTPFGPKVMVAGDSFTEGGDCTANLAHDVVSYHKLLGDLLGWRIRSAGVSGSGYVTAPTYRSRIAQDLTATGSGKPRPDGGPWNILIVTGGINDFAATASAFTDEIPLLYATIRAAAPLVKIIVVLPVNFLGAQQLTSAKVNAIRAAWVETGGVSLIIDPVYGPEGPWFSGAGRVGTPLGDGNSDYYLCTDALHPSSSYNYSGGHDYFARRIAASIAAAMPF